MDAFSSARLGSDDRMSKACAVSYQRPFHFHFGEIIPYITDSY